MTVKKNVQSKRERVLAAIDEIKRQTGKSEPELAEIAGISASTFSHLRSGRTAKPSKQVLQRIEDHLKVNSVWVRTGQGSMFTVGDPWHGMLDGIDWEKSDVRMKPGGPQTIPASVMEEFAALSKENRELKELNVMIGQLSDTRRAQVLDMVRRLLGQPEPPPATSLNEGPPTKQDP